MISPQSKVSDQRSAVSSYTTFFSQSFNSFSMLIILWSCLSVKLSSPAGFRFPSCCCTTLILVIWCLLLWFFVVIIPVTCQLSTWSFSMWVFLVTCRLSAWSSVTWSWFKVENVNTIILLNSYLRYFFSFI